MELRNFVAFDRTRIESLFDAAGLPPPGIFFAPPDTALPTRQHRQFARLCDTMGGAPGCAIRREDFRMEGFGNMTDFIVVAERQGGDGADRWRFTYCGSEVDTRRGDRMTGQVVSCLPAAVSALFTEAWDHAALSGGKRVLTHHRPPQQRFVSGWSNLFVPITSPGPGIQRVVDGFVSYCRPEDGLSAGLDAVPEPILIVDGQNRVLLANRAAREMFDRDREQSPVNRDVTDYTQSDLVLYGQPGAARRAARHLRIPVRCLLNGAIVALDAEIGTMSHLDEDYFVVALRRLR